MLLLYFYKAANPADGDFRDCSCRKDPDLEVLSLGICRPALRRRLASRKDASSLSVMFYTTGDGAPTLHITALVQISRVYSSHAHAESSFRGRRPSNLLVDNNPCRYGTTYRNGVIATGPSPRRCYCRRYSGRAGSQYFRFKKKTSLIRVKNPITIPFEELTTLCPRFFNTHPKRRTWQKFQQATSNTCHEIFDPIEAQSLLDKIKKKPHKVSPLDLARAH
jgi:hypothetical protein